MLVISPKPPSEEGRDVSSRVTISGHTPESAEIWSEHAGYFLRTSQAEATRLRRQGKLYNLTNVCSNFKI